MPTLEGIRMETIGLYRKKTANLRKKQLKVKDFTIISNNCWSGICYEAYNLVKQTPTVGLFMLPDDYLRFISNLRYYVKQPIKFIKPEDAHQKEFLEIDARFGHYPIGMIDDVQIQFLHYHSEEEVIEKWTRRCQRINWDKLVVKFNDLYDCDESHIKIFKELDYNHKLFFTCKKWDSYPEAIVIPQIFEHNFVTISHEPWGRNRHIDITDYLNNL